MTTDAQLVQQYIRGDQSAFTQLVKRYSTRLRRFVQTVIRDWETAEDIVQTVFLQVHLHAKTYKPSKKFSTWVFTIAANRAKNELRRRARARVVYNQEAFDSALVLQTDPGLDPQDEVIHREFHQHYLAEITKLNPATRRAVELRDLEDRPYAQISKETKTNVQTVKTRINRGRHQVAHAMRARYAR